MNLKRVFRTKAWTLGVMAVALTMIVWRLSANMDDYTAPVSEEELALVEELSNLQVGKTIIAVDKTYSRFVIGEVTRNNTHFRTMVLRADLDQRKYENVPYGVIVDVASDGGKLHVLSAERAANFRISVANLADLFSVNK